MNQIFIEMQEDIDMILKKGFGSYEEKIYNLFIEIAEDDKRYKKLFDSLDEYRRI
jgi:hypothetical protein